MRVLILLFIATTIYSQTTWEKNLENAFCNSKKGIYWSLTNIPFSKSSINKDLIANDMKIASIKLKKEVHGVEVVSTGFCGSCEVVIKLYKSYDNLIKESFIKEIPKE